MDYKAIFQNVTRTREDGKIVGIPADRKPKYKSEMKKLRIEFNKFTKDICPSDWSLYKVDENWQMPTKLGSTYKPYFWNQFKHSIYNINGISIWLKIDSNRLGVVFGTTKELEDLQIQLPSLEEQKKIVEFLDLTNKEIDLLEELKNQKEKYYSEVFNNILKNGAIK